MLVAAAGAGAVPPSCDLDCPVGPDPETTVDPSLFVSLSSGRVQDSPTDFIDCGQGQTDCSQGGTTFEYTRTCDGEVGCTYDGVDTIKLDPTGGPAGFGPNWVLCRATAGGACTSSPERFACDFRDGPSCLIDMYDDTRVELTWIDVTDPQTSFVTPRSVVGPTATGFNASASDNATVARVEFRVDGGLPTSDATPGDGFSYSVNPSLYTHGSTHQLTAQAFDTSGRGDTSPASTTFTVDRQTSITFSAPDAGGHFQAAPQFSFTKENGASATCSTLTGTTGDDSIHSAACDSTYTPQATTPGDYRVRVVSTDAVGNVATADRSFTIDPPQQQQPEQQPQQPQEQPNQPVPGGPGGTETSVDDAAILAALGKDVDAAARGLARTKQSKLVRARGRSVTLNALTAGTFALVFKGAAGKANASRAVTIAKGSTVAAAAGSQSLKLKLTKAGARLLRRGKRIAGTLTLSFTRPNGSKLSRSRKVTLKRR
jgi:hypothetical protein